MSAQPSDPSTDDLPDDADDLADLLPDDLAPAPKKNAVPMVRSKAQIARAAKAAKEAELAQASARLAQIVNLHIGGYSLTQIGASIGATPEEVDRLLTQDTARYVRSQPALRAYVRNWVSERYAKMIEADYPIATDPTHRDKLENQDRVMRMLDRMAKLHGAEAPAQSEVKIDAAPEAVERMVAALAAGKGLGYDDDIFDIDPDDVHEAVEQTQTATVVSGNALEGPQEGDPDDGF